MLAVSLLLLAACADLRPGPADPAVPSVPPPEADTCKAAQFAGLIGQDATALERVLIMRQIRVIRPGDAITMDLRPTRINFDISEAEAIARIWCG